MACMNIKQTKTSYSHVYWYIISNIRIINKGEHDIKKLYLVFTI